MRGWVDAALRSVSDVLVPPLCTACRAPLADHDALCPECWRGIDFIGAPLCDRLGLPLPFDTGGTMVSAAADPRSQGQAMGAASSLNSLTAVMGPVLGAGLLTMVSHLPRGHWAIGAPLFFGAALQALSLVLAWAHGRRMQRALEAAAT